MLLGILDSHYEEIVELILGHPMNELADLDALIAVAHKHACLVMLGSANEMIPVFALVQPDGGLEVIGCPWRNDEEKEIVVGKIKRRIRETGTVAYSFITEAWAATQDHAYRPGEDLRPAQRADRREVVIACATNGKDTRWAQWAIERNAAGHCAALTPVLINDEARLSSWLAKLL